MSTILNYILAWGLPAFLLATSTLWVMKLL
jgi:hypothetical protein